MEAVVFNNYLAGLGGGERSSFAHARALQEIGYDTVVMSKQSLPERDRVEETFGHEFAGVPMISTEGIPLREFF